MHRTKKSLHKFHIFELILFMVMKMNSYILEFFLFAIIVQCCQAAGAAKKESNSSSTFLTDIIREQQAESDLQKQQQQPQRGPQSYRDKAMMMTSKGSKSIATPSKVAKNEAVNLKINEATNAVEDLKNRSEGSNKEINKRKGKGKIDKNQNIEDELDAKSKILIEQMPDGNFHSDLIQPLDMQLENPFNELEITEESLPEVQMNKTTNLNDTISTGNDGQIRGNRGRGKGRKKKKSQKGVESSGDLVGSGSGKQYEDDTYDYNTFAEKTIILTDIQFRQFQEAFEPFLLGQETYLNKELEKLNDGEILHKSIEQLVSGMTTERHDSKWHKDVRKVLVTIIVLTHKFWQKNVAQIMSKEPRLIFKFYSTMTAIYLGPKEGRSAQANKMIPQANKLSELIYKSFLMHNQKSAHLFIEAVKKFEEKIKKFELEFDKINHKNLKDEQKIDKIKEALKPVTSFYKLNFVDAEKFNEFFRVALLMQNKMQKDMAKLYTSCMRLADAQSAQVISQLMGRLLFKVESENFKENAMNIFDVYFEKAHRFPSDLDIHEMDVARIGLIPFAIEKPTDTNT